MTTDQCQRISSLTRDRYARKAAAALRVYQKCLGDENVRPDTLATSLLTDLHYWAARERIDLHTCYDRAELNSDVEFDPGNWDEADLLIAEIHLLRDGAIPSEEVTWFQPEYRDALERVAAGKVALSMLSGIWSQMPENQLQWLRCQLVDEARSVSLRDCTADTACPREDSQPSVVDSPA